MSKYNFFTIDDISSENFTKFEFGFISVGIMLMVDSTNVDDVILYSFDGITIHGNMVPTKPNQALSFDNRHESSIWIARESAGSAVSIRIEAWA